MEEHEVEVNRISERVRSFHERGEQFRISHGSTNSTRQGALDRDPDKTVDTSRLNRVLSVNAETMTVQVEPNVPMDRLVEATLEHGLIPPVVMEFPGITVGGGFSGTSGESSSFKHGFFNRTLNSAEIVLGDGSVVVCSEEHHPDLFHGAAGALGTLGVTTMVELRLRKANRYVATTYHPVFSIQEAMTKLRILARPDSNYDYVEGILFSRTEGAIITGQIVDAAEGMPVQRFSDPSDPWFYLHVKDIISTSGDPVTEAIPLPEYLFRYDRGGFWVGRAPFNYFTGVPFNKFTRWFLDDFLHTRMLYKALHGSGQSERMIIQDVALPYETASAFVEFTDQRLGIWPLWLCPLQQSPLPTMHPHYEGYEDDGKTLKPMLNIGLWGQAPDTPSGFVRANKDLEDRLQELKGMKWLYAQTFYSEEDFWTNFDKKWYDELRRKYRAEPLPSVYEKVRARRTLETTQESSLAKIAGTWPIPGLIGIWKAIQSGDYLLARNAKWRNWVPR
jgi:hypothetical protein